MTVSNTIEGVVMKLARQINAYDEASLMSLWERLAERVRHFEPTRAWEEAAIALSIVQAMHFKNQLFNYHWAQSRKAGQPRPDFDRGSLQVSRPLTAGPKPAAARPQRGKLLPFGPRKD